MFQITRIFFTPPMAIARLGGSSTPLESYSWREDPSSFGSGQTVIVPEISLEIQFDGSVRPYLPSFIRFRDNFRLRPVAPFFELWARVRDTGDNTESDVPLTLAMLEKLGGSLEGLTYHITAANRKAERRSGDAACGFVARLDIRGNDHRRRELLAVSPRVVGNEPLVPDTNPVPLGFVQVIKPIRAVPAPDEAGAADPLVVPSVKQMGVDMGVLRIRFTPAAGEVYGPPSTSTAPAPGTNRIHEMVKKENRFLNPRASWNTYDGDYTRFNNPEPSDTYDGASVDRGVSWGVVDDTCDAVIEASLVIHGNRFRAFGRVFAGPPDFAPDRRHFISLADDLADRELDVNSVTEEDEELTINEVADLFQRVFETVSLTNLDSLRSTSIAGEMDGSPAPVDGLPLTNSGSMTARDKPYADKVITYLERPDAAGQPNTAFTRLPYSNAARQTHAPLADVETLVDFLVGNYDRVKRMIRPPYARLSELPETPATPTPTSKRDARVDRDNMQDMRMPPFMRSNTASALSLSWRQYAQVMGLLEYLKERRDSGELRVSDMLESVEPSAPGARRPDTALWQHVQRVVERRKKDKDGN